MRPNHLDELRQSGHAFDDRFELVANDIDSPAFEQLLFELKVWLDECVSMGRFLPPGTAERRRMQGVVDQWTTRLLQCDRPLDDVDRLSPFDPAAGEVLPYDQFPYQGLAAVTDAARLYGRSEQVSEYSDHLEGKPGLLIQSESGGGKSSLALAGIIPTLAQRHADWLFVDAFTPGARPAEALRLAIGRALQLSSSDPGQADAVQASLAGRVMLVYVDQLEELLTVCSDPAQQESFSGQLAELADRGCAKVMATLRSDHQDRLAHSVSCRRLYGLLSRDGSLKTLPPMTLQQVRTVIRAPADRVGLRFVPVEIVDRLATEAANAAGGLPLLQFALLRLWQERPTRDGQPLDFVDDDTYRKLPTVPSALGSMAAALYSELDASGLQAACKRLMLELTVLDERLEVPLRRRRPIRELSQTLVGAALATEEQFLDLIRRLMESGLLVRSGSGDSLQLEVAHESLFRYWKQFRDWFESEDIRVTLRETRMITRDAISWLDAQRSPDLLRMRGKPLSRAQRYAQELWLEPSALPYVQACASAARRAEIRQSLLYGSAAFSVVALLGASWWWWRAQEERGNEAIIASAMASASLKMDELQALDLAYTVKDRSNAPLAQALDRLRGSALIFPRYDGPARFSPSGLAVTQLVRGDADAVNLARIRPLDGWGVLWSKGVDVKFQSARDERLVGLEVGPPIRDDDKNERRLVVATWINTSKSPTANFTRSEAWSIARNDQAVAYLGEAKYPDGTNLLTDMAFATDGMRVYLATWQASENLRTQVLEWAPGRVAPKLKQMDSPNEAGATAITAIANAPDKDVIAYGRANGSVHCGGSDSSNTQELSPVMSLRLTEGGSGFVAVHASNFVTVGRCGAVASQLFSDVVTQPVQPRLKIASAGEATLTYFDGQRAICRLVTLPSATVVASRLSSAEASMASIAGGAATIGQDRCWAPEAELFGAVSLFDRGHLPTGYVTLPNAGAPLLRTVTQSPLSDAAVSREGPATGVPVAQSLDLNGAIPSGQAGSAPMAKLIPVSDPKRRGLKVVADGQQEELVKPLDIETPERMAINAQGVVALLIKPQAKKAPELVTVPTHGLALPKTLPNGLPVPSDASCMRYSPDGRLVLVGGSKYSIGLYKVDNDGGAKELRRNDSKDIKGQNLTACALSDGDTPAVVLGDAGGLVWVVTPGIPQPRLVSALAAYRSMVSVLDVAMDSKGRFLAVVTAQTNEGPCPGNGRGHMLRVFDLHKDERVRDVPVANTCLSENVVALDAMRFNEESGVWDLPVYARDGKAIQRLSYHCRACESPRGRDEAPKRLRADAEAYEAKPMSGDDARAYVGLRP